MRHIKKYLAFFLLLVISAVILPKELIHHYVDHHDTEDARTFPDAPSSIEHEHEHCEFLKINVPLYHQDPQQAVAVLPFLQQPYPVYALAQLKSNRSNHPSLRGPPNTIHS